MKAKTISNLFKVAIVIFIAFNYMYQSKIAGHPLVETEAKSLLWVGLACFLILCPIDASIFIKNLKNINKVKEDVKKDIEEEQ